MYWSNCGGTGVCIGVTVGGSPVDAVGFVGSVFGTPFVEEGSTCTFAALVSGVGVSTF